MTKKCAIIFVTYNSERHIHKAMECVARQSLSAAIIIIDTGSKDTSYLERYRKQKNVTLVFAEKESGFCKGNNIGMQYLPAECEYVFFLNPDAFIIDNFIEKAVAYMEVPANCRCGALTGAVIGYDIEADQPRNAYDTTGVFRTWYGRWYDRDQGQLLSHVRYKQPESLPAICGAVFFCRFSALKEVLIREQEVFDATFYMYKEDIDLSIRLRNKGWRLDFVPDLIAYHCRGWQADRSKMPRRMRVASARNELVIHAKMKAPVPIGYSLLKYALVKVLDR